MNISFWADVSVVFLAIETFFLLLIPLVAFYFAVRGLNFLHIRLPGVMSKAQGISRQVRLKTEAASQRVVDPVVRVERERIKAEAAMKSLVPGGSPSKGRYSGSRGTSPASSSASGESEREL